MEYFSQQLINGLTLGSIYGLIAIGYTMVYGIVGMINFAHGEVFMIGAFIALIAILSLFAVSITSVPLGAFRGADPFHDPDRRLGLEHRARRLPPAPVFLPARASHHRYRHVDYAAKFRRRWRRARVRNPCLR